MCLIKTNHLDLHVSIEFRLYGNGKSFYIVIIVNFALYKTKSKPFLSAP